MTLLRANILGGMNEYIHEHCETKDIIAWDGLVGSIFETEEKLMAAAEDERFFTSVSVFFGAVLSESQEKIK